jgi:hypothetical protein
MFATCLFCHSALGANEAIEHFPVGRRLAFDAAKGRLWVVCRSCERWNLSPLEERWEAIEEAERLFRDAKKRLATENIGLARLPDRTELVRIGAPLRPEFAAWRYGDQFGRRHRRNMVYGAGGGVLALGVMAMPWLGIWGLGVSSGAGSLAQIVHTAVSFHGREWKTVLGMTDITDERGAPIRLTRDDLSRTVVVGRGGAADWGLKIRYHPHAHVGRGLRARLRPKAEHIMLNGEAALRALAQIMPVINKDGANKRVVQEAVAQVEEVSQPFGLIALTTEKVRKDTMSPGYLVTAPLPLRLALEMALHEDDERRALEGELEVLEERWREAEEIAAIADSLTLPAGTEERLTALKMGPRALQRGASSEEGGASG